VKLKALPEDFRVREQLEFERCDDGPYYVHLLRKRKVDTLEALARVARRLKVARSEFAFAGLKDRQGETEQWVSVRGRRLDYRDASLTMVFKARAREAINSKQSTGNRFEIVVRDLSDRDAELAGEQRSVVESEGLPNYFDDQRFGCLQHGQGFILRTLLAGDPEEALRRAIATPSPTAISGDVKLKRALERYWGDWEACASIARGPLYGRIFEHLLASPDDFTGALERMPQRQKLIHAFAFQSFLWNRAVDRTLYRGLGTEKTVSLQTRVGRLLAWGALTSSQRTRLDELRTPLYGAGGAGGAKPDHGDPEFARATQAVIEEQGLRSADFSRAVPGMVLRSEPRAIVLRPSDMKMSRTTADELGDRRLKLTLSFALPRGSYATLVVKRLFARSPTRRERQG